MNTTIRRALTTIALTVAMLAAAGPAHATATPVYVEDHTGSAWPVYSAQDYVDRHTGTNIVYGTCRTGYKCVRVYEKTISSSYAGYTCLAGTWCLGRTTAYTRIYLNPQRNSRPYGERIRIATHELGHAFGIGYHSAYCTNVMYGHVRCPDGSLPTYRFTDPQKTILAGH